MYGLSGPKKVLSDSAHISLASVSSSPQTHCTLLPQKSLTNAPTGVASFTRSRYRFTCSARIFVANVEEESTPMPLSAAMLKLSVCVQARYRRGCGFWNGFGSTRRCGTFQYLPSYENSSDCQILGSIVMDSSHMPRVSRGSIPR